MTISENTCLYYSKEYKTFSASVGNKDKNGEKHSCYISVSIPDTKLRERTIERLIDHNANACKVSIKKGFLGSFYASKKGVSLPQVVLQEFDIEEYYPTKK